MRMESPMFRRLVAWGLSAWGFTAGGGAVPPLLPVPAGAQISENVIFHANLDEHPAYNDVWGYTAPNGDEYALLGTRSGVAVINVSDPKNPYQTGFVPGGVSPWRDIKTFRHWAYAVNEGSGGLEIIDLSDPEAPVDLPNWSGNGFTTAHNLFIQESRARLYLAGSDAASPGGLRILDLADPVNPVEIGSWEEVYCHDVFAQNDYVFASAIFAVFSVCPGLNL